MARLRRILERIADFRRTIGVILLIGLANFAGYLRWHHQSNPRFALQKVSDALRNHDLSLFEKYVDVDAVAGGYFDQHLLPKRLRENPSALAAVRAREMQALARRLRRWIETSYIDEPEEPRLSLLGEMVGGAFDNGGTAELLRLSNAHHTAFAYIHLKDPLGRSANLDVKLVRRAGTWRISEVTNVEEFVGTLQESEKRRVNASQKAIQRAVSVSSSTFEKTTSPPGGYLYKATITERDAVSLQWSYFCHWRTSSSEGGPHEIWFRARKMVQVSFICMCEPECTTAIIEIESVTRRDGKVIRRQEPRPLD